jgi:hypothetical protein
VAIPADLSLQELRVALAPAVADAAVFDGWTDLAVRNAAELEGADPEVASFAFRGGAMAMIAAWISHVDLAMASALPPQELAALKIRERIRTLVQFRLDAMPVSAKPCAGRWRSWRCRRTWRSAASRLAERRRDVAARGRHCDRLQSLHQAHDLGRALHIDARGLCV